eukprot:TRINITY_DN1010_c0_g1_i2.p1 TRINITY_DN1010_c0_g1~~TRINITY_DN1010_c0_g1_i2.p1  ORF type:complete len:324 (-),score=97.29 TRINITY_DN1010_c0_g1_i2:1462-2346(-)
MVEADAYDVDYVAAATGRHMCIRVILSPQFPQVAPTIAVVPILKHPLVGPSGAVLPSAHEALRAWNPTQYLLGNVVLDIAAKLTAEDATSGPAYAYGATPLALSEMSFSSSASPSAAAVQPRRSVTPPPNTPVHINLDGKSVEELRALLDSDKLFEDFYQSLPEVAARNTLLEENCTRAKQTMALSTELESLMRQLADARAAAGDAAAATAALSKRGSAATNRFSSPAALRSALADATHKAEEESDAAHVKLVAATAEAAAPVLAEAARQYCEQRTTYYEWIAKSELLEAAMHV